MNRTACRQYLPSVMQSEVTFPRPIKSQFAAAWASYAHPGTWPDADMLPLGELPATLRGAGTSPYAAAPRRATHMLTL
jgi:hypothetical protein